MRSQPSPYPLTSPSPALFLLTILTLLLPCTSSAASSTPLTILNNSTLYTYAGCFNETTALPNTTQQRALAGGAQQTAPGAMTVPLCLDFCAGGQRRYAYAGLEYSRECWCADALSALSARLDDAACGDACDGDAATACGGALALSLYNLTDEARSGGARGYGGRGPWGEGESSSSGSVLGVGVLALWLLWV